ncbi:MAG: hypothetical protein N2109_05500 [Fimbriimonadales bacterium]|nr:hypothetical protein [Fimbriimonadales bacterium]
MDGFPRTVVGGVSMPRLIIGTNWFRGFSHTSLAKDRFIVEYQDAKRVAAVVSVFLEAGCDAVMGGDMRGPMKDALAEAEQKAGRAVIRIITPHFNIKPGGPPEMEPERVFDDVKAQGATFCMPHQAVTDALIDRRDGVIRDIDVYTRMIRERGMIPGLSTHMPEAIPYTDSNGYDIETYIQIYNAAGFLMQVEADWVMRVIRNAAKPVMTIKPLAAGRLLPPVGLAFVWNTIRDQDMVTIGCTTPDEAKEVIELSLDFLERRIPSNELQRTRSKRSLESSFVYRAPSET